MEENITITVIRNAFRFITPWRHNLPGDYYKGWNDCVKEIRKNRKKYIKVMEDIQVKLNQEHRD